MISHLWESRIQDLNPRPATYKIAADYQERVKRVHSELMRHE